MLKHFFSYLLPVACLLCIVSVAKSQAPTSGLAVGDTTGSKLEILEARRYNFQKIDSTGDFVSLAGSVRIRQGKTLFYCDSAVLDQKKNIVEAFGNIHINDEDSVHTYSQYLKYYGKEKDAILKNKVKLTDGKGVLTTNELHYNTINKVGTYVNGGKVVTGTTVLTSTEGVYYGETRDIYFKKKVVMTDPDFKLTTDTLLYNTFTEIARFTVPTVIKNKSQTITTSEGFYDMQNKKAVFGKRPFIDDKDYTLTADDIAIDEATGFGDALGSAVYKSKDTTNTSIILANRLQSNNKNNALLATQKPVMIIKQGGDSIYIAADTLYSAKLTELRKTRVVPDITSVLVPDSLQSKPADTLRNFGQGAPLARGTSKASTPALRRDSTISLAKNDTLADGRNRRDDTTAIATAPVVTRDSTSSLALKNDTLANTFKRLDSTTAIAAAQRSNRNTSTARVAIKDTTTSTTTKDSSNNRFVEAYYNVRIFSDSLQAVGDSMFYSFEDSAFRLFNNPVVWAKENQITGDTIYLFTTNKKPKRLYVFENALAVNKSDQFFNQVKGTTINGYFLNGDIDFIKAKGSAENIYYAVDEQNRYIGVNKSSSDVIDMYFASRKPRKIVFRNNLQGTTYPMNQLHHSEMRLRGFKWLEDKRPKTSTELFGK